LDRTGLPEEPPGASGGWEQDKEHRRTAKVGEFSEAEPTVESNSKRGSEWIPMVSSVLICDRGSLNWENGGLQVEIGNVELEPESVGRHQGIEDARGIDCLESRYAGVRRLDVILCPVARSAGIDGRSAIRGRLR
jgi:hypothetical protein